MSLAFRRMLAIALGAALLMGLTAAPLSAAKPAKKLYSLSVTSQPTQVINGDTVDFTATFKNTSPDGISSFNSLVLTGPGEFDFSGASVVVEPPATSSSSTFSVVVTQGPPFTVTVTGLSPVTPNESVKVHVTDVVVDVEPNAACGEQTFFWGAEVWTGSNTGGNVFYNPTGPAATVVKESSTSVGAGDLLPSQNDPNLSATNVGSTCAQDVALYRDSTDNIVWLIKPEGSATWVIEVSHWPEEDAVAPLPWTQVTTDDPDASPSWSNIEWCLGSWDPSTPSEIFGDDGVQGTADDVALPAGQVSCLLYHEAHVVGNGKVEVTELYFLDGDWGAKRG